MDTTKRGGVTKSLLLLLFHFLISQCVAATEDEYAMMLENQGYEGDIADSRSQYISSLNHILEQQDEEEDKRSSSFYPLRGKKMLENSPEPFLPEQEDKRSQFFPLRGKKIPTELKRASSFMPMRGRKDEDWNAVAHENEEIEEDKRASSFMPMRGKKQSGAYQRFGKPGMYESEITFPFSSSKISDKRMSFIPSRGRKFSDSVESYNETHPEQLRNKRSAAFLPMRGRRLLSNAHPGSYGGSPGGIATSILEKKQYAFMPMRGRRFSYIGESKTNLSSILKSNTDNFSTESALEPRKNGLKEMFPNEERNSQLRRKRETDDISAFPLPLNNLDYKRLSSFMPMRGKKNGLENTDTDTQEYDDSNQISPPMLLEDQSKSEQDDVSNDLSHDKRASSFMPMRGRRYHNVNSKIPSGTIHKKLSSLERKMWSNLLHNLYRRSYGFLPMRGRRSDEIADFYNTDIEDDTVLPTRGRRWTDSEANPSDGYYSPFPYFIPAGIGSALISRPFGTRDLFISSISKAAAAKTRRMYDWDSVKRAFHASRGKRTGYEDTEDEINSEASNESSQINSNRIKRNVYQPQSTFKSQRSYLALKRPMSFFATRGKRMDANMH